MDKILEQYHKERNSGKSLKTIKLESYVLRRLYDHLQKPMEQVTKQDLVDYSDMNRSSEDLFDSSIEKILYEHLEQNKIKVHPQYWTKVKDKKSYRLDFALFVNGKKYDIEIDGDKAHSQKDENDILRDIHLGMEG